jgi:hypothetical protein
LPPSPSGNTSRPEFPIAVILVTLLTEERESQMSATVIIPSLF